MWRIKSKEFLFPIEWDEPFGIVMIEALACGTPVIGFKRGSVPEVIDHGITGFIVNNEEEMISALKSINQIIRTNCRQVSESRFNSETIAKQYLGL